MEEPGIHDEVVAFLSDPATHGIAEPVEVRETHGALVFLAGDHALKLKRPVAYDYMDFSTPERRRTMLQREFELNNPAAPGLYLAVEPITREADGTLALDGTGAPVDWVLRMRRFPATAELSQVAARGELDAACAAEIGRVIATYHADAAVASGTDGAARVGRVVADIGGALSRMADTLGADEVTTFRRRAEAALGAHGALLDARAAAGFVRRCHGDLHLGNMVLVDGHPVPFDALEFDERLATTDVLYDLAFLVMDLLHARLPSAASIVMNRYLHHAGVPAHYDGLAAMPLFLALRAAIRAMVSIQRAEVAGADASAETARRAARAYLGQACGYLAPSQPRLVAVGGLSGSGKTTLATALAPRVGPPPGAVHLRSDLKRKALFGVDELMPLPERAYAPGVGAAVYAALRNRARRALKAGFSVVLDAVHSEEGERRAAEALAAGAGVPFNGLWLTAAPEDLLSRVNLRHGDASDADAAVVRRQLASAPEAVRWQNVDASGTPGQTLAEALRTLNITPEQA